MESYEQERERQREAAAERVAERTTERGEHEAALARPGGIAAADTPERIAKRLDRLSRYYAGDEPPPAAGAAAEPEALVEQAIERVGDIVGDGSEPEKLLEKIINTADFVGIRYLDAGVAAARAIGRVNIRDAGGRLQGYGTGSLVSPTLLLTNHHVLPDADDGAQQRDRVQLPGRHRRPAAARAGLPARSRPLLPRRRRARLRARRGRRDARRARAVRLQPADRGRGQGDHRRVRHDRAASARREEAGRAAREPDRRHPRALPALLGRHRAGLLGLARVQRPVGGRRAAPRERAGAGARASSAGS